MNLLTIILPVFNGYSYLSTCLESIIGQTFTDFNLIIVNDGSTDKTIELINEISDRRIKVLNKKHSGIIDSFNLALSKVNAKYIARVDADDYYYPSKFFNQIKLLEENNQVILVGTGGYYMSEKGRISKLKLKVRKTHNEIMNGLFHKERGIIHSSIVVRTDVLKKIGGYTPNIFPEDYELYFRIGKIGKLANLVDPLMAVRIHESYSHYNLEKLIKNYDILIQKYKGEYKNIAAISRNLKHENQSIILNRLGINNLLNGKIVTGLIKLIKSFFINPKRIIKYICR